MEYKFRSRRILFVLLVTVSFIMVILINTPSSNPEINNEPTVNKQGSAINALKQLLIKGRAPKTGYDRSQFGSDWSKIGNCSMRNIILNRDLKKPTVDVNCNVISGELEDPYTGKTIEFKRGSGTSSSVQIDHVVALSDAWQKGARYFSLDQRIKFANDPLELLAVDGNANVQKGDGDAATWLPPNKSFRCVYVARQIEIKIKYKLWITQAEHDSISSILEKCPLQRLPNP